MVEARHCTVLADMAGNGRTCAVLFEELDGPSTSAEVEG